MFNDLLRAFVKSKADHRLEFLLKLADIYCLWNDQ